MRVPLTVRQPSAAAPEAFARRVGQALGGPMRALSIRAVYLNVGLRCNLACWHCHVESSPLRDERMSWETMKLALAAAAKVKAAALDITGGAPELHPRFKRLVAAAREQQLHVIVRTNLTVLLKKSCRDLPEFFKAHHVRVIGSLPSFIEEYVDRQRGPGVYRESIDALRRLNAIGYGIDPTLPLDLVYSPPGASLPRRQFDIERDFKRELDHRYGVRFTQLLAIANMAVGRFRDELHRQGKFESYARLLVERFNADTLEGLMCRHQLHVGWDGTLYDCDFNCGLNLGVGNDTPANIRDFDPTTFLQRRIRTADHCFGCAAGWGSSFGGALV